MQQTWRGCPVKRLLACVHCQIKLRLAPLALGLSLELKELELGLDSCSDAVNFNLNLRLAWRSSHDHVMPRAFKYHIPGLPI